MQKKIFLVDDDDDLREGLADQLEVYDDLSVTMAANGATAFLK